MNEHQEYREKLSALLDGALSDAERETVLLHLRECTDCRTYFEEIYALHLALGDMEEYDAPADFAEGVMARLHGEDAKIVSDFRTAAKSRRPWRTWGALAACAAVVVLVVSVLPNAMRMKSAAPEVMTAPATAAPMAPPDEARYGITTNAVAGGTGDGSAATENAYDAAAPAADTPGAQLYMSPAESTEPIAPAGAAGESEESKLRVASDSGIPMTIVTSGPNSETVNNGAVEAAESALPEVTLAGADVKAWLAANGWQGESGDWYAEADALRALPEGLSLVNADTLPEVYSGPVRVLLEEAQP